ncbi:hypothetical protein PVAND_017241 [Polypedilum vanderplanki]|uniref:cathepsin L n=1 Tax=Polypedilum vanderplanki TaxID=319348 RepID=A0A9J6BHI5_POLVA|nr:hypothetical protein PVAND_017241 [Polypedilum vanderplanki]
MKSFLIFFVVFSNLNFKVKSNEDFNQKWEEYKNHYNKSFKMEFREERCRRAFKENLDTISQHNEAFDNGKASFKLGVNHLADLSNLHYLRSYVRLVDSDIDANNDRDYILGNSLFQNKQYPESLDWREKGFVTKAKNQKSCGSCYAFSIAGSIEGQIFKRINKLVELSPQQIVDCSSSFGNHGCAGGSLRTTLKYLEKSGGLMRESDYPYTSSHNKCSFDEDLAIVNITSWSILPSKDEEVMKGVLNEVGPIAISIDASLKTFQLYSEGVYDDPNCSSTAVNHAMLLVGYTPDAWILKNWWGKNWGINGYMLVKRGVNKCGIANYAAYAVV